MPVIIFLAGLFPFTSCSRVQPSIEYGFISLVYYQVKNDITQRFSFFVIANDDDGIENLDELDLYNDYEQLHWIIGSTDWMTFTQNDKTWIGSWALALQSGEDLPRGQFRAVLRNKGGEKTEKTFSFDAPAENRFPFPKLEVSGGAYTITSQYPDNRFVCYDSSGNYVSVMKPASPAGKVSELSLPSNIRSVRLWAEDSLYFTSALTEAVSLR
ncbi:MAG: hypothetical protein FWF29_03555 [Treponema sp.]|nr:hypothetical protein [Treponema sp.]